MKVMHVIAGTDKGGAATFFTDAVLALHEAGLEQYAVVQTDDGVDVKGFQEKEIPFESQSFNGWWRGPTRRAIVNAIAGFQPDVIQYWTEHAGSFAPQTSRERNVGWYDGYHTLDHFANCDYHVGITEDLKRHIEEDGVDPRNVGVIHTYARSETQDPVPRAEFETPDGVTLLLALAQLHWKKGFDTLLNAMPRIPEAHLWIAGDGSLREALELEAKLLNIEDRVRFLGRREDRAALLAAADICLIPSRDEAIGTAIVEAWMAGTPVIAATSQGAKAYVAQEENGLLVSTDDPDAIAKAVNRLSHNAGLKQKLIEGGGATYRERFTREAFVRDAMAFYQKVAEEAARYGTPYPELSKAARLRRPAKRKKK